MLGTRGCRRPTRMHLLQQHALQETGCERVLHDTAKDDRLRTEVRQGVECNLEVFWPTKVQGCLDTRFTRVFGGNGREGGAAGAVRFEVVGFLYRVLRSAMQYPSNSVFQYFIIQYPSTSQMLDVFSRS